MSSPSPTARIRQSLVRASGLRVAPAATYARKPVTNYTDACEAPAPMWEGGAIPLRTRRVATRDNTYRAAVERTYDHPAETPPHELSLKDVNSMYCLGNDDLVRTFPEGLGGKMMQLMPPGHPRGFLYRSQSHLLNLYISKLSGWENRSAAIRSLTDGRPGFIFDGPTGTGKSALMAQAVHYARSRRIITFYIPNASAWTHGEWAWPSTLLPGFFDVPDATRGLLQFFARAHAAQLRDWKLRVTPKDLPLEEGESQPNSLYGLCVWGYSAPAPASVDRSSVALKFLLDELMAEQRHPILFVVDGMNLLCQDTHFRYPHPDFWKQLQSLKSTDIDLYPQELPRIPGSRLSLMRALNRIQHDILIQAPGNNNKFFVTGTSRNFKPFDGISGFPEPYKDKYANALDEYAPFDAAKDSLLHPMTVDNFSDYEYRSFLRFLVNSGELAGFGWGPLWHHSPGFERKLYKIDFLSSRNPQQVVDHYHGELVWRTEYQRLREKQYLIHRGSQLADANREAAASRARNN